MTSGKLNLFDFNHNLICPNNKNAKIITHFSMGVVPRLF